MKKFTLTFILLVITASSMIYAFIKADESTKAAMEAVKQKNEAERLREQEVILKNLAQDAAAEAKRQEAIALDIAAKLADCQGK